MEIKRHFSEVFYVFLALIIVGATFAAYERFVVLHDYVIETEIECDPSVDACFVAICDPEEEECAGDPEEDTSFYKLISRNVSAFPDCSSSAESACQQPDVCGEDEKECVATLCDTENASDRETECTNPVDYTAVLPEEDETAEEAENLSDDQSSLEIIEVPLSEPEAETKDNTDAAVNGQED